MSATLEAPPIATGWFPGLSLEAYLAIDAMSASGLETFRRSPAHFRYGQLHPKAPTDAMKLGTALHMALLEPELFEHRYVTLGQCDGVKKDGARCTNQASVYRSDDCDYCGVHDPKKGEPMMVEVIVEEALSRIEGMQRAILAHPKAREFFRGQGESELTGVWTDERSGVPCKIRLDRDIKRAAIHSDIKATVSAEAVAFTRQCGKLGYVRRSAFYRRGMAALGREAKGSVLIAVENTAPHCCQTFRLDEFDIKSYEPEINRVLIQYAHCREADTWPGYPDDLTPLKLSPWDEPHSTMADFDDYNDTDEEEEAA